MKTALLIISLAAQNPEAMIVKEARSQKIPEWFALSVARRESNLDCAAIGRNGERGVMQIKPSTAVGYGFRGNPSLLNDCQTGVKYGMMYLKAALDKSNGNLYRAALLYNGGLYTKKKKSEYAEEVTARGNPEKT